MISCLTHLQTAHFFIFPLTGSVSLLCGMWQRKHPVGICVAFISDSTSMTFCGPTFMCLNSFKRSRSPSFGVADTAAAVVDWDLLPSIIVNCGLMIAAVPMADKTQTSSLKIKIEIINSVTIDSCGNINLRDAGAFNVS